MMLKRIALLTLVAVSLTGCCLFQPDRASMSAGVINTEPPATQLDAESS
jgi:hypothetical protein